MKRTNRVVINGAGTPINGATVDVFLTGTTTAATIYSDEGVTTKTNPLTTDSLGRFWYYAEDGRYDHKVSGTGLTTYTETDVEVADMKDLPVTMAHMYTAGANAGAKIVLAITDLPSTGGTVDARGLEGAQTIATNPFTGASATKKVTLLTGATTFTVNAKLVVPSNFRWIGQGTVVKQNFSGDHLIESADLTNGSDDVKITGLELDGNSAATGYALIHIRGKRWKVHGNRIYDNRALASGSLIGIRLDGVASGVASDGSRIYDNTFTIPWIAVSIADNANGNMVGFNRFVDCFSQIDINGDNADAAGNIFSGNTIQGGKQNSFLQSVTGAKVTNNTWRGATGPLTGAWLTVLLASGTAQKQTDISGNLFEGSSLTGYGLHIQNNVAYFTICNNSFISNGLDGIFFNLSSGNTGRGTISGNLFLNNGLQDATAGFSAMRFTTAAAATVISITVSGNGTFDDQGTQTQTYGMNFAGDGAYNNFQVSGNDFGGNKTGAFNFAVTPTNSVFGPNKEGGVSVSTLRMGDFVPGATGQDLGATGARWDLLAQSGNFSTTLGVTGITTLTGGIAATGRSRYSTVPVGPVAYASFGTDTTPVAGTIYWADIFIPRNVTLTGAAILNGSVAGTDKYIVALYNSAGTLVANSALAGTTTSGTNAFQSIAFTGTYAAVGPARYWIAVQVNGTTDRFRSVAASTFIDVLTDSDTGVFGTLTALTPPTTFTADIGPIAYVYA